MENQEYVFEEKAESVGDEIIIGDVEFKLETNKGNTSFGEIEPQGDISVGTNQLDTPLGSVVLEGSIADRLRDLEAIVARIKEQRRVSEENFQARMKQHEIEAEQRAVVDRELTEALARQMSYAMDKIGGHERRAGEHEERLQRLEENSSSNMFIFDDIDRRLLELGAGPAHEAPQGDDLDCCSSTGCIGYIRLFCAADTILLLYSLLYLCRTYCMLLVQMTDQWAVCLYR